MANKLEILGFNVSERDSRLLLEKVLKEGSVMESKSGKYVRCIIGQGVEVIAVINSSNKPIDLSAYFFGNARYNAKVTKSFKTVGMNQLSGNILCQALPKPDMTDGERELQDTKDGSFPIVLSLPEFGIYNFSVLPIEASMQITAFAYQIDFFKNVGEYMEFQKGKNRFEVKSFVPIGMFDDDGMYSQIPDPTAVISGEIVESLKLANEFTGKNFGWLRLDTVGGEMDVVFKIDETKGLPKKGQIVGGMFLMGGRIVDQVGITI